MGRQSFAEQTARRGLGPGGKIIAIPAPFATRPAPKVAAFARIDPAF
jgi:hypothetical protein